jgi:hypothetical protein
VLVASRQEPNTQHITTGQAILGISEAAASQSSPHRNKAKRRAEAAEYNRKQRYALKQRQMAQAMEAAEVQTRAGIKARAQHGESESAQSNMLEQAMDAARKELEVHLSAREDVEGWDAERESRILDATGTDFEALDHQARTLRRIQDLQGAVVLAEILHRGRLTSCETHWEERVLSLERLCDFWKRKWNGMAYWHERRLRMEMGLMVSQQDKHEYSEHIDFGITLLDGVRMLFSWIEGIRVPDDVAVVLGLSRRATNIAIDVSTGLERLRVHPYLEKK